MGLRSYLRAAFGLRDNAPLSFQELLTYFQFDGTNYAVVGGNSLHGTEVKIGQGFESYVRNAYQANGVVFACTAVRMLLFSEARFGFRDISGGRPGDLSFPVDGRSPGSSSLSLLQTPWAGGTTGDLLSMMEVDVTFGGNAFIHRPNARELVRLRPDWTTIVYGTDRKDSSMWDLDARLVGYVYKEGGPGSSKDPIGIPASEVAHYMPYPDPLAPRRGMSWMTPVVREVASDSGFTAHKNAFLANGATVNFVLEYNPDTTKELFDAAVEAFKAGHEGAGNAGRTLHLLGATAHSVGSDFKNMDLKAVQGAGETRIAAASGVPPVIVGLSEGLDAATYSNYSQARRRLADGTLRPLWRNVCGSLARIMDVPAGKELWYDDRDIAFLREDQKDAAEIQVAQASAVKQYVDAGFEPDSVVDAVTSGDMNRLSHTGLPTVQVQKGLPGPSGNGDGPSLDEEVNV